MIAGRCIHTPKAESNGTLVTRFELKFCDDYVENAEVERLAIELKSRDLQAGIRRILMSQKLADDARATFRELLAHLEENSRLLERPHLTSWADECAGPNRFSRVFTIRFRAPQHAAAPIHSSAPSWAYSGQQDSESFPD